MADLKTTPEERSAASAQSSGVPGSASELAARMAYDIDTLLAEVERLRAGIGAIRRIESTFAPLTVRHACQTMHEISTVLGPLETK
jgi:hypothetical protein